MITKKILLFFFCITIGFGKLFSQSEQEGKDLPRLDNVIQCGSPFLKEYEEFNDEKYVNPELLEQARKFMEQKTEEFNNATLNSRSKDCNRLGCDYTIPVIVHVIHDGEPIGTGSNISYKQIMSQIDALNAAFNSKDSSGCGAEVRIHFCMATMDMKDNALVFEQGVERILADSSWVGVYGGSASDLTPNSNHIISPGVFENIVKPITIWNPKQYLNIWTYNCIAININSWIAPIIYIGYANYPATPQLPAIDLPPNSLPSLVPTMSKDGIVIMAEAFTSTLFGGPAPSSLVARTYTEGDVLAHEVGHWLGLRHVNGDNSTTNCGVDDGCLDTYACTSLTSGCTVAAECNMPVYPVENYMAYTDDVCRGQFTAMQAARMRQTMMVDDIRRFLPCSDRCGAPACFIVPNFKPVRVVGNSLLLENTSIIATGSSIVTLEWTVTDVNTGVVSRYTYNAPNAIPSRQLHPLNAKGEFKVCLYLLVKDAYGKKCENRICRSISLCNYNLAYNVTAVLIPFGPPNSSQYTINFTDATPTPNFINWWHYNITFYFADCTKQSYNGYSANSTLSVTLPNSPAYTGYTITMEAGIGFGRSMICKSSRTDKVGNDCNGIPLFKKEGGSSEGTARKEMPNLDLNLFDNSSSILEVFPSPTKDELNINLKGKIISRIEIIDMYGKSIKTQSLKSDSKELMNIKDVSAGTYIIRVTDSNEKSYTNKFIK